MKKSPLFTLAAGAVLAAVLMVMNLNVTKGGAQPTGYGAPTPAATSPAPTAAPTTQPRVEAPATYAGTVGGGGATIAIAVKNGKAVAYLCDGKSAEAWLQGTATGGALTLTGAAGASLTGTYGNGVATGTVIATGKQWAFSVKTVRPPSGLYRATATVRNATVVGGWIVLADGTQVGVLRIGDVAQPAPLLNVASATISVDGTAVPVVAIDGTGL